MNNPKSTYWIITLVAGALLSLSITSIQAVALYSDASSKDISENIDTLNSVLTSIKKLKKNKPIKKHKVSKKFTKKAEQHLKKAINSLAKSDEVNSGLQINMAIADLRKVKKKKSNVKKLIKKLQNVLEEDFQFRQTPIIVPAFSEYYSDDCSSPIMFHAIPVALNSDGYTDFIVHYLCFLDGSLTGTLQTEATPDALVAYVSNQYGMYTVDNLGVFGDERPKLGGASRKYARGDVNGDGVDDFAFAMNWEDGRKTGGDAATVATVTTEPSVLLSGENYTYTVHRIGARSWAHSVDMAENSIGTNDVLFAGYSGDGFQAFRIVDGEWIDVENEYPSAAIGGGSYWANAFRFFPATSPGSETKKVVGTFSQNDADGTKIGVALFSKTGENWARTSEFLIPVDFVLDFISWSDDLSTVNVVTINGERYIHGAVQAICTMNSFEPGSNPVVVAKIVAARDISGEFIEGQLYDQDNTISLQLLAFFEVIGDQLIQIESPIMDEESEINANFMHCADINADGYDDLVVTAYTSGNDNRLEGGLPVVYVNNQQGKLDHINIENWPRMDADRAQGYFHDVNDDGLMDLVLFEREAHLHRGIHIFLANDHVTAGVDVQ
jgi:hypothetical protein